jgi:glycosyltransferase involved in cell wall biosynthesis
MSELLDEARKFRLVVGEFEEGDSFDFTVFLGLYNADEYLDDIFSQLTSQIDQNFKAILADNFSTDSTWERISEMAKIFEGRMKIVRNPLNLGGAGNLALNYDLIETDWWCAWHQDDFYFPNHIASFRKKIASIDCEVIGVASDMGSISNEGNKMAIKPRANWLLNDYNRTDFFIANSRSQILPFPATAFKRDAFQDFIAPWHSTTFFDTEATLLMCSQGKFEFSKEMTMRYRENEMSESHSLNSHESVFGMGVSLARIFSSDVFVKIARGLEENERKNFLKTLNESIEIRLGPSEYSKFVQLLLAESCMVAWGYKDTDSIAQVKSYYKDVGSTFTPELLSNILKFLGQIDDSSDDLKTKSTVHFLNEFLGSSNISVNYKNINSSPIRKIYDVIMKCMPYQLQKNLGKVLLKLRVCANPKHPWNFKWK